MLAWNRNRIRDILTLIAACMIGGAWANSNPEPDFDIRGRAHLDYAAYDSDKTQLNDDFDLRRAWLGVDGRLNENWTGRIEYELAGDDPTALDVYLRRSLAAGRITLGQSKVPMGLNQLTSSNNITFIERSAISNIIPDAWRLGVGYELIGESVIFQSKMFGRNIEDDNEDGDNNFGGAMRVAFNLGLADDALVHLGASIAYEDRGDQNSLSFGDRPEARPDGTKLIDTGTIEGVQETLKYGFEVAAMKGPLSAEAEYVVADLDRENRSDPQFAGYHIQASYVLTGESRQYSGGKFSGITPSKDTGAWEVAVRLSDADLSDGGVNGGQQKSATIGLNYYVNSNLRLMANLIHSDIDNGPKNGDESINIAVFRAMYSF